jgi:KRAB domain-containing zinc finger protein
VCLKKFSHKPYFKSHMSSHTGTFTHLLVEKDTSTILSLIFCATGGTLFECDQCKRTFINKDSLQKHLISHSSTRLFDCQDCGMSFKRSSHLKDHLRTHSEAKPYVCKECSKSFKWQVCCVLFIFYRVDFNVSLQCVLKVHENIHNKECYFCCETCGKQLKNKSSLSRHSKRHTLASKKSEIRAGKFKFVLPF